MLDSKVFLFCIILPTYHCIFSKLRKETVEEELTKSMLDETAEIPHFTRRFGFVDYRRKGLFDLEKYEKLRNEHAIELNLWKLEFWNYMVQEVENMKFRFCKDTLKDPVLKDNNIMFDENADEESIELIPKEVIFFRYKKMPLSNYDLAKCPITIQGEDGYFAYITLFERTQQEGNEDFYFILLDLYHENVQDYTNQVVVAMRTKLGATMPLFQWMSEFLQNSFNRVKYRLEEFRKG